MSKSLELLIFRKIIKMLVAKKPAMPRIPEIDSDAIPSLTHLAIPSVSDLACARDPFYVDDILRGHSIAGEYKKPHMVPAETCANMERECCDDHQPEIISILENTGYRIKEVKSLASGEKVITVDQIMSQMNSVPDCEYAARSRYE